MLPLEGESSLALVSVETSAGDINPETKSVPVTSLEDDFFASGFWYEGSWDGTQTPNLFHRKVISKLEPNVWVATSVVAPQWPGSGKVRFYAVSPASRQGLTYKSLSTDQGAPVIVYQVAQDVASQLDVLESVSSDYAGNSNAVVPLSFTHALTAVRVSCEDLGSAAYVRSVTLSGVYSYGLHEVGSSVWTGQKNVASYTVAPDVELSGTGEEQILSGKNTMLLMPQTLPAGAKLSVVLRMNGHDYTLNADLSGTEWQPGYLVDYRVVFENSGVVMGRMEVRNIEPVGGTVQPGVSQQVAEVVSSGLTFTGDWVDVPWEVKGFSEDGDSWSDSAPSWLSTYTGDGDGNGNAFMVSTGEVDDEKRVFVKLGQVSGAAEKVFEVVKEYESNNLTFTIVTDGDILWKSRSASTPCTIKYKKNDGEWVEIVSSVEGAVIPVVAGDVLEFVGVDWRPYSASFGVQGGCTFNASKSVMSLLIRDNLFSHEFRELFLNCTGLLTAPELPATTLAERCYYQMFKGCTSLTSAPELPASTLAPDCYNGMFSGCISLTDAPELPATKLAVLCYSDMFYGCTSLTEAPQLPAATLSKQCYHYMFYGCTSLAVAPELPAMILSDNCYTAMFYGCTSLTSAPELPATTLASGCYSSMFRGCTNMTDAPELPANVLSDYCYSNMFSSCTNLTIAPELPATTLANNCYQQMFLVCYSLTSAPELPAVTLKPYCYKEMFSNCTSLNSVPSELPATTLAENCYEKMFYHCTGLTVAPEISAISLSKQCCVEMFSHCSNLVTGPLILPATTLAQECYSGMFYECRNLSNCPQLPATTLASYCYNWMFLNCQSLTSAPELPATTLAERCYNQMFSGCTSLTSAPELPAMSLAEYCYGSMFQNCSLNIAPELPATTLAPGCYFCMFSGCRFTSAPVLPAETLAPNCYNSMFDHCTGLTSAPELPATTLAQSCYYSMFNHCTSLTSAPELPAEILTPSCYRRMFEDCTKLTTAPELPATTLEEFCYAEMFKGCDRLTSAPELPARTLVDLCYYEMFRSCSLLSYVKCLATDISASKCLDYWFVGAGSYASSTKTFVKPAEVNYPVGVSGIPDGWTIQNI